MPKGSLHSKASSPYKGIFFFKNPHKLPAQRSFTALAFFPKCHLFFSLICIRVRPHGRQRIKVNVIGPLFGVRAYPHCHLRAQLAYGHRGLAAAHAVMAHRASIRAFAPAVQTMFNLHHIRSANAAAASHGSTTSVSFSSMADSSPPSALLLCSSNIPRVPSEIRRMGALSGKKNSVS